MKPQFCPAFASLQERLHAIENRFCIFLCQRLRAQSPDAAAGFNTVNALEQVQLVCIAAGARAVVLQAAANDRADRFRYRRWRYFSHATFDCIQMRFAAEVGQGLHDMGYRDGQDLLNRYAFDDKFLYCIPYT